MATKQVKKKPVSKQKKKQTVTKKVAKKKIKKVVPVTADSTGMMYTTSETCCAQEEAKTEAPKKVFNKYPKCPKKRFNLIKRCVIQKAKDIVMWVPETATDLVTDLTKYIFRPDNKITVPLIGRNDYHSCSDKVKFYLLESFCKELETECKYVTGLKNPSHAEVYKFIVDNENYKSEYSINLTDDEKKVFAAFKTTIVDEILNIYMYWRAERPSIVELRESISRVESDITKTAMARTGRTKSFMFGYDEDDDLVHDFFDDYTEQERLDQTAMFRLDQDLWNALCVRDQRCTLFAQILFDFIEL